MASEMHVQLVAGLLRRGRNLDQLSTALTLFALLIGLAGWLKLVNPQAAALIGAALFIAGVLQKYFAVRVALDAELFALMASDLQQLQRRTIELDQALGNLGQSADKSGRNWSERSQGALRLLRRQALCLAAQVLIVLATLLLMPWLSLIHN
jgi:hypothetical protein